MDLHAIADRTRLPLRKLRYVIDHGLISELPVKIDEESVGRPRYFDDEDAFDLACAAAMLVGGMKRDAIIQCMRGLTQLPWAGEPLAARLHGHNILRHMDRDRRRVLSTVFAETANAVAMFGDGINVRVRCGSRDTLWRQPGTLACLSNEYQPLLTVELDLAKLRDRLKGNS